MKGDPPVEDPPYPKEAILTTTSRDVTQGMDGDYRYADGRLRPSGIATFTTSSLSVGTHIITASYQGDGTFDASWSDPLTQTVLA
jgi:hypothetical protein